MKELIYHRQLLPAIARWSNKTAVIDGAYQASFAEHGDRVFRLCDALKNQLGVKREDRFAVMAMNSHSYLELYHAAFFGAGVINPLNLRLAGKELDFIIRDSGVKVIFCDQHFIGTIQLLIAESENSSIEKVILMDDSDVPCDYRYEDLLSNAEPNVPEEPSEEDAALLMYTGGTTATSKGVLLSQRAEVLNCYHTKMAVDFIDEHSIGLLQAPLFHAATSLTLMTTPAAGGTLVIAPIFDPKLVLDLMYQYQVTATTMVPTMVAMMLGHADFDPGKIQSLRNLVYGGSPMPVALLDALLALCPDLKLYQGYGMTECASVLTVLGPDEHIQRGPEIHSAGLAVPGVVLSIQDEYGNILANRETGEVCAKAGNYMDKYWNKPEATEEAFRDGWYHSGDAGYMDDKGYLYLVDRVKDMIISGGENVYSIEVENAIGSHPAVMQVAVIGIPSEQWGEAVHAIVVQHAGASVTEEELIAHARISVAGYKVPKTVELRSEPLPLSGALKVLKRDLREPYWQGHDKRIS